MIFYFFYSLCFLKKNNIFNSIIIISSLSTVIMGVVNIDRSRTVFWMLIFIMSFLFFKQYMKQKQKKYIVRISIILLSVFISWLAIITIARWGDREDGATGNLLVYIGQPFINFCNIWEHIHDDHFITSHAFPLLSFFFNNKETPVFFSNLNDRSLLLGR